MLYLGGDHSSLAAVVHEDAQHLRDDPGQVELKLPAQRHHCLLHQQDDRVLQGTVHRPEILPKADKRGSRSQLVVPGPKLTGLDLAPTKARQWVLAQLAKDTRWIR